MLFKKKVLIEKFNEKIGYLFSYFLFTTIFYYILKFLNKLPENWSYYHIIGITLLIVLIGTILKKILK